MHLRLPFIHQIHHSSNCEAKRRACMPSNHLRLAAGFATLLCLGLLLMFGEYVTARAAGDSSWGFALTNLDKTCKPCDDFYEFAMGGWMKANPIPAEYATWGTFTLLRDNNLTAMRTILRSE